VSDCNIMNIINNDALNATHYGLYGFMTRQNQGSGQGGLHRLLGYIWRSRLWGLRALLPRLRLRQSANRTIISSSYGLFLRHVDHLCLNLGVGYGCAEGFGPCFFASAFDKACQHRGATAVQLTGQAWADLGWWSSAHLCRPAAAADTTQNVMLCMVCRGGVRAARGNAGI